MNETATGVGTKTVVIAGNPNCGKSTLFNRLTGLRQKAANYPGITVEKKIGTVRRPDYSATVMDLPGTYSLSPRTEDARVAARTLAELSGTGAPAHGIVCVIDGHALERSLPLVLQIQALGRPMMVAVNMADELRRTGARIDAAVLEKRLGVPVRLLSAKTGEGVDSILAWMDALPSQSVPPSAPLDWSAVLSTPSHLRSRAQSLAREAVVRSRSPHSFSDKVDKVVMHRVAGPVVFALVVLMVFQAVFSWAAPLMDLIDGFFAWMGAAVGDRIQHPLLRSFLQDGVVAGVGGVVVFLPQILIVFFFISLMENSGYLARAAVVVDRFFGRIGLQGKSFLPFVSSYACAIPGIMAARTIENRRERFVTIFVAPFMTCSARLPVYALLVGAFVPPVPVIPGVLGLRALTLLSLYAVGFIAAVGTAWALKSRVFSSDNTLFHLEIPPYRWPSLKETFLLLWDRSRIFLRQAGGFILMVNIGLWFLAAFPRSEGPEALKHSYAGRLGVMMEPVIRPLGFDWKIGVGLIGSQAAREVVVSTLSTLYSIEDGDATGGLQAALRKDMSPLSAVSLLVFFALAMQCMATTSVVRRETGGWKIPLAQFLYMNALAYTASLIVFQGGRWLGF